jgi:hypothetical protein
MSGYTPDVLMMKPEWNFVQKPFGASEIRERIGSILADNCLAGLIGPIAVPYRT